MYKVILTSAALLTMAWSTSAAVPAKSKKHHNLPANSSTSRRHGKKSRASWRSSQSAPTPERYKEIQQALASKGYFKDEPNGEWGPSSIDALKRFQADQNLMPDGKISSLSLIALGLGPKRLTAKTDATPAPQSAPPPATPAPPTAAPAAPPAPAPAPATPVPPQ